MPLLVSNVSNSVSEMVVGNVVVFYQLFSNCF